MTQNLFSLTKTLNSKDLKEYMIAQGIEFKGKNGFCPFHSHDKKTPSLGISTRGGEPFFNCFACGTAGDITKFAQLTHKTTPLDAATKVLDYFKISYIAPGITVSDEEKARIEQDAKERREKAAKEQEKARKKEERLKDFFASIATESAPRLAENFVDMYATHKEITHQNFPNQSATFSDWAHTYLGYDPQQQSIAILIRDDKQVYNIKYREKYEYDKDRKIYLNTRSEGKWIGFPKLMPTPFPIEYFKEHQDKRVIICEGEKDALNLLSYDINVLTLGGVTVSWEQHKNLLKDKTVFIWFDNDNAGYENALKRYMELEKFVSDIFIVPFFLLNAALANKYDISDYLSDNADKFHKADDIFNAIAYSCFKLTNTLVEEIEEYTSLDLKDFKRFQKTKDFRDIRKEFMRKDDEGKHINVILVRGELDDEEAEEMMRKVKGIKKSDTYKRIIEVMTQVLFGKEDEIKKVDDVLHIMDRAVEIKQKLLTDYRQTHIADMFHAFLRMSAKVDHTFGEYKGNLYIWTGTHYLQIDTNDLAKFVHNEWMYAAHVDFKKQTRQNVDQVVDNILSKSRNLNEDKMYEQRRVINVLNGAIFITKNGKFTFVNEHRKKDAATNILAFEFDAKAKAPKWRKFLNRVLPEVEDQQALMEFMGYCFMPSHKFETFLFLFGKSGANGKSVILDTIKRFFGDDNVSGLQLQQLEGHQLQALTNKILNIGSEIDKTGTDKGQLATLKQLVSPEDPVQINPKNDKPYLLLSNEKPKMAFSGNDKPRNGLDNAIFRRMLLLSFDTEIKDDEKIRGLSDRFNDEMAGIFNMALEGMERLVRNGKFTRSNRMKQELEEYKDEVNPLRTFIRDAIIKDKKIMVPSQYVYALYRAYIFNAGGKPQKDSNFWKGIKEELVSEGHKTELKQIRLKQPMLGLGERTRCALYIGINKDFEIDKVSMDGNIAVETQYMNIAVDNSLPLEEIDA